MAKGITRSEIDALVERLSSVKPGDTSDERSAMDAAIAALARYRRYADEAAGSDMAAAPQVPNSSIPIGAMKSGPFFGMGMNVACAKQLEIAGGPQTPSEIWKGLSAGGFTSAHNNPVTAVHTALTRRSKTHGDVLLVGKGKWDLKSKYSEEQLAQIAENIGGMPGRDHSGHREQVKRGMLNARVTRGVKFGARSIITEELAMKLKPLIADGLSLRDIGKAAGISHATVRAWKERIENWEPGQKWPPDDSVPTTASTEQLNNVTPLRAVK